MESVGGGYGLLVDEGYLLDYRMQASSIFLPSLAQAAVLMGTKKLVRISNDIGEPSSHYHNNNMHHPNLQKTRYSPIIISTNTNNLLKSNDKEPIGHMRMWGCSWLGRDGWLFLRSTIGRKNPSRLDLRFGYGYYEKSQKIQLK